LKEDDNILARIREILGSSSTNFSILEHQVDIKLQMEYFEYSKSRKDTRAPEHILSDEAKLYDNDISLEDKKTLLVRLASVEKPEAYRILERFMADAPVELRDWAIMATQESRMLLETHLLDEQQVYISTGLGGKDGKLRYFIVAFSEDEMPFTPSQRKLIESEFSYSLRLNESEVEKLEFYDTYFTLVALVPLSVKVRLPFQMAIDECNSLGRFIKDAFIITNVKELDEFEIDEIVRNPPSMENDQ